ncbi:MAG: ChbG/HpnK family deacetylase [Desulfovibrio sp.]|nr:ChbG/HpnK family deacetylase [Desulfovibrio sp.]
MRVILHADDCGLARGISEDILLCLKRGPLQSATLMTGGDYAAEAAAALNAVPGISVSLHLNLLEGRSTAPPASVAPLVDGNGFFRYSLGALCAALHLLPPRRKRALLSAVRTEFSAQADWFLSRIRSAGPDAAPQSREAIPGATGEQFSPPTLSDRSGQEPAATLRPPLRLDGHLHVHALPLLKDVLRAFIREYRPEYVRLPLEPRHLPPAPPRRLLAGGLRRELLALWALSLRGLLDAEGIGHNRFLSGVFAGGCLTLRRLRASLAAVRRAAGQDAGGILEIMCHPGGLGPDEAGAAVKPAFRAFYLSPARAAEKAMLLSPELPALLADMGFVAEKAVLLSPELPALPADMGLVPEKAAEG